MQRKHPRHQVRSEAMDHLQSFDQLSQQPLQGDQGRIQVSTQFTRAAIHHFLTQGPPASNTVSCDLQGVMFSGFREMDSASSGSPTSSMSPASTAGSSRSFGSGGSKARLQDKQIEKGQAILMRDYVSAIQRAAAAAAARPGPWQLPVCSSAVIKQPAGLC